MISYALSEREPVWEPVEHVCFEGEKFVPICQCHEPDRKVTL